MVLIGQRYAPAALRQTKSFVADLIGGRTDSELVGTI